MVEMESVWTPGHTPPRGSGAQAPATGPWPGVRDRYECWAMLRTGHRLCPGAGAAQCWHHTHHTSTKLHSFRSGFAASGLMQGSLAGRPGARKHRNRVKMTPVASLRETIESEGQG